MWTTEVFREAASTPHITYACVGTGVTHQDDDLCFWEARPQQLSDGKNSSCHLLRRVLVIICSYPQHHHLDKTTNTLVTALSPPASFINDANTENAGVHLFQHKTQESLREMDTLPALKTEDPATAGKNINQAHQLRWVRPLLRVLKCNVVNRE